MKLLQRIMALGVALILAVSVIGTVDAEAATKPSMNVKNRVMYVGGSKVMPTSSAYSKNTYTLKVKNRPKKYACTWTSSDESVATVEKNKYKGIVTAVAPGTATITVNVVDKTTSPNTLYTLSCKVEVRENCAAVAISPSSPEKLKPGDTLQLTGTMYTSGAKQATPGVDTTDIIHWISSNTDVATVSASGLVKAVSEGTAKITCYTVQASTGTYSQFYKATATDTVDITVKKPDIEGIVKVKQESLNTLSVFFGNDYSKTVSEANFKINRGSFGEVGIKSFKFDETGKIATVVTESALPAGYEYVASMSGTTATVGNTYSFTVSDRTPNKLVIYTSIEGNKVIEYTTSTIQYKLYDIDGVDITPLDESTYNSYGNRLSCETVGNPTFMESVYDRSVWIGEAGKSITVKGTYNDGKVNLTAFATISSVTEASTMTFVAATLSKDPSVSGARINWDKLVNRMSLSDFGEGYKIVAKVQKADGTFIYSDDVGSNITFEQPDNYSATALFVSSVGTITPLAEGSDRVFIKYGENYIGTFDVQIGPARVASSMKFLIDGAEGNRVVLSDAFVTNPSVKIAVYDNYNELFDIGSTMFLDVAYAGNSGYTNYATIGSAINSDGTVDVDFYLYGEGTTSGKTYTFTVKYNDGVKTLAGSFSAVVYKPNTSATSSYQAVVVGDTDMVINSGADVEKSVSVSLVEMKGSVRYSEVDLCTKSSATVGDYYAVVLGPDRKELAETDYDFEIEAGSFTSSRKLVLHTVTGMGGMITKMPKGSYQVVIYRKTSGTSDPAITGKQIVLTDTQKGATFRQKSNTTSYPLSSTTGAAVIETILSDCFEFTVEGASSASAKVVDVTKDVIRDNGIIFIKTVEVTGTITIGGSTYVIKYPLSVGKTIRSTVR